jgi:hypothetical protein
MRIVCDCEACNNAGLKGIDQPLCVEGKTAQLFEILVRSAFYSLRITRKDSESLTVDMSPAV